MLNFTDSVFLSQFIRQGGGDTPFVEAGLACRCAGQSKQLLGLSMLHQKVAVFHVLIRRGGQHKLSMKLLASMVEAGLAPDAVTVGELISSLSDRERWDEAQRVVEIAEKTGAIPPSSLDSSFEVDVSHLPSAIAKVKVRSFCCCSHVARTALASSFVVHIFPC